MKYKIFFSLISCFATLGLMFTILFLQFLITSPKNHPGCVILMDYIVACAIVHKIEKKAILEIRKNVMEDEED